MVPLTQLVSFIAVNESLGLLSQDHVRNHEKPPKPKTRKNPQHSLPPRPVWLTWGTTARLMGFRSYGVERRQADGYQNPPLPPPTPHPKAPSRMGSDFKRNLYKARKFITGARLGNCAAGVVPGRVWDHRFQALTVPQAQVQELHPAEMVVIRRTSLAILVTFININSKKKNGNSK